MHTILRFAAAVAACALALPVAAPAQPAGHASEADKAAVRNFVIDDSFIQRVTAAQAEAKATHMDEMMNAPVLQGAKSLDEIAARIDAKPGVHALLAKHGLTAREVATGGFALMAAEMVVHADTHPEEKKYIHPEGANPANVAYVRIHQAQLKAFMDKDDKDE